MPRHKMPEDETSGMVEETPVYDPATHVCLDGVYTEHPEAESKPRVLTVDGVNYEHTDTDATGVWMYRPM